MTLTPIERRLEDATVLYVKAQAWQASIGLFAELARIESDNTNAWLGIGSALWRLSLHQPELLEPAVSALKRAVDENQRALNKSPKQLLFNASQSATKAGINVDAIKAFSGDPKHFAESVQFTPQTLLDATRTLGIDDRAQLVSLLSEVPGELFDALLNDLAENDADSNVRVIAAKSLRERPQKPAAVMPTVGGAPDEALDAVAAESAELPEPEVTMVDSATSEIASAIPNVTEVIPTTPVDEVVHESTEVPVVSVSDDVPVETPAVEEAPAESVKKPIDDEAIRAQLEARRQRLMGKK